MRVEFYKSGFLRMSWKWRLIDEDEEIVAFGRGFNRKQNAERSVEAVRRFFKEGNSAEIYEGGRIYSSWKWRARASNGRIIASDKGFTSKDECEESLNMVKKYFMLYS